jgi:hypothetical protein
MGAGLGFAAIWALALGYNLQYFYLRGAAVLDAGWFAWLSRFGTEWPLANPPVLGPGSFMATHVSPIFFATAWAGGLAGLPHAVWFSLLMALWPALLWLGLLQLLADAGVQGWRRLGLAALLTFGGGALSMWGFPHIESFIPALFVLGLAGLRRGWWPLAWLPMLAVREDAGLHAALALAGLALAGRDWRLAGLAALACAAGLLALAVQKLAVPGGGHALGGIYVGDPPLAHLSAELLGRRALYWASARSYVFLPLALLLAAAWHWRDRALAIGIAVGLPWLALSAVAASHMAGGLWGYYAAPLAASGVWPLLLLGAGEADGLRRQRYLRLQAAMGAASAGLFLLLGLLPFVGGGGAHDRAPWRHLRPPSLAQIQATEAALDGLRAAPDFARLLFDDGAASLLLDALAAGQYRYGLAFSETELAAAAGFVRFIQDVQAAEAQEAIVMRQFHLCEALPQTALLVCQPPR